LAVSEAGARWVSGEAVRVAVDHVAPALLKRQDVGESLFVDHGQVIRYFLTAEGARLEGHLVVEVRRTAGSKGVVNPLSEAGVRPARDSALAETYSRRAAIEREFGRLKNEWAVLSHRVSGLDRVALQSDLTSLAKLSSGLARGEPYR
jgi:hypothetical protein